MLHTEELILAMQRPDGSWGPFHTLSMPTKAPLTTEQALRRLRVLGFTGQDEPIQRAVAYMERHLPEPVSTIFFEKKHDPKIFADLMLATWLRLFVPDHPGAVRVARQWAAVVEAAFENGERDQALYLRAFEQQFGKLPNPKAGRLINFDGFYQIALLQGMLTPKTENAMLDYMLAHPEGISYVYTAPLNRPPAEFASRGASHYLAAMELLAGYALAPEKLGFVRDWLAQNRVGGQWDLGPRAKDGVYLPLSDSWRRARDRRADCTARVTKLLERLK
jgi:hypothetical protein